MRGAIVVVFDFFRKHRHQIGEPLLNHSKILCHSASVMASKTWARVITCRPVTRPFRHRCREGRDWERHEPEGPGRGGAALPEWRPSSLSETPDRRTFVAHN